MVGLAHRGFELHDYGQHLVHALRRAGYWSGLIGEQHLSVDPGALGYDEVVEIDSNHVDSVAPAALALLRDAPPRPFFLVDLAAVGALAQQLAADPEAAATEWSARTTWTGAFTSQSHARGHGPMRERRA
jgi:hypothetical protein